MGPRTTIASNARPRITVITPNFNGARFVEETIRSVLLQDYPNLEYIVVDGGSSDGSHAIIERYAEQLIWDSRADSGQANAINHGLERASGEVVAWLNSDDCLLPGALEAVGSLYSIGDEPDWIGGARLARSVQSGQQRIQMPWRQNWPLYTLGVPDFPQEATFVSRKVWDQIGPLREDLNCVFDVAFFSEMLRVSSKGILTETPLSMMNVHPGQKTKSMRPVVEAEYQSLEREWVSEDLRTRMALRLLRTRFHAQVWDLLRLTRRSQAKKKFRLGVYDFDAGSWNLCDFPA